MHWENIIKKYKNPLGEDLTGCELIICDLRLRQSQEEIEVCEVL